MSTYEEQRAQNIAKNKELLRSLGLDKPFFEPKQKRQPKQAKKRKAAENETYEDDGSALSSPPAKAPRTAAVTDNGGLRRSTRNAGKAVDYKAEKIIQDPEPVSVKAGIRRKGNTGPQGGLNGRRVHNPKVFGSIPGIEVGTWWETREECSVDAVHAPFVAGIAGGPEGAYSVALSGGYEDDVDLGYAFTYTGSGGRDLKGTKNAPKNLRTAPQSFDQSFEDHRNKALKVSSETKEPVRVIRGYKLDSKYAPYEGYRYDGLYIVEKVWMEKGLNAKGFLVCKFAFKRLPDQPPLPVREDDSATPTTNEGETSSPEAAEAADATEKADA
ncbi:uhrf1 protein [Moniliophthora roreri MCA 2997]|uniref:Uhrf1 protein n=1 Tax=Moniliophthora roreri (strain MCA 2997) TaxID=1381753 RepID=V2WPX4_MONRO|nr:uhrf1 protein [Moniliophthora roreri MCA 2997]